jgi:hypothetical protein
LSDGAAPAADEAWLPVAAAAAAHGAGQGFVGPLGPAAAEQRLNLPLAYVQGFAPWDWAVATIVQPGDAAGVPWQRGPSPQSVAPGSASPLRKLLESRPGDQPCFVVSPRAKIDAT